MMMKILSPAPVRIIKYSRTICARLSEGHSTIVSLLGNRWYEKWLNLWFYLNSILVRVVEEKINCSEWKRKPIGGKRQLIKFRHLMFFPFCLSMSALLEYLHYQMRLGDGILGHHTKYSLCPCCARQWEHTDGRARPFAFRGSWTSETDVIWRMVMTLIENLGRPRMA